MNDEYLKELIYEIGEAIDDADPDSTEVRLLYKLHDMILQLYYTK